MPKPGDDLVQIAFEEHQKNVELALIHLRDARNIVQSIPEMRPHRALPKAAILLATAAIETNLSHLSGIAERFIAARPSKFSAPHMDFVRGVQRLHRAIDRSHKLNHALGSDANDVIIGKLGINGLRTVSTSGAKTTGFDLGDQRPIHACPIPHRSLQPRNLTKCVAHFAVALRRP